MQVTSKSIEYGSTIQYDFPDDYLVRSILATILFCPCGLLALLNAVKVRLLIMYISQQELAKAIATCSSKHPGAIQ